MEIPAYYDLIWTLFFFFFLGLLGIVVFFEVRRESGTSRIIARSLVQLLFPIIGFVIWAVFFFSEKDMVVKAKEI